MVNDPHDHDECDHTYHWRPRDYVAVAVLLGALAVLFILIVEVLPA